MVDIVREDAPWSFGYNPYSGGAYHQWVGNAKPTQMVRDLLQYMRIDPALRTQRQAEWNAPVVWPMFLLALLLVLAIVPAWLAWRRSERATAGGKTKGAIKDAA